MCRALSVNPLGASGLATLLSAIEQTATALRDAAARIEALEAVIHASQAQHHALRDALQGALRSAGETSASARDQREAAERAEKHALSQETRVDALATELATVREDRARIAMAVSSAFGPKVR